MVKSVIVVEPWRPVAHARQLMLMHSFSFLPVRHGQKWFLLSELALAQFLNVLPADVRKRRLGWRSGGVAHVPPLEFEEVPPDRLLAPSMTIDDELQRARASSGPTLWLVVDEGRAEHLAGLLLPFELM